ncbi:hypothetical protein [Streptomyces sp. NPDC002394]
MLFSVPDEAWWWIAAAATVAAVITFVVLPPEPDEVPQEVRAAFEQNRKIGTWRGFVGISVLLYALAALTALLRPEPTSVILFVYSVVAGSMPMALLPFRRRMHRHYFAQLRTPGSKITMDRLAAVWLYSVLGSVIVGAAVLVANGDV